MEDLTGRRFTKLIVLGPSDRSTTKHKYWVCRCDCGNITSARSDCLKSKLVQSCGCLNHEPRKIVHGGSRTSLYRIFYSMKQRCYNPNNQAYKYYGGRGISICDEWNNNFAEFQKWSLENGYVKGLTIDRINVNGNYEPDNCRWVTIQKQSENTRRTHYITYNGETKILRDWCRQYNVNVATACQRIKRGWSFERTFINPSKV